MKHLLRTILLLGVLCLAGCKEEETVSFSVKEYKTSVIGEILTVNVTANCPWTLSENSQQIVIEEMAGEGNASIRVNIARNFNYDELTHVITITSEDRTSSDVLTIVQDKNIGTEVGDFGLISEQGGTFEIPIKTNDDIASVDTPDWMTYSSSRGLTGYTYVFTVEPNKTGSVREGTVSFKGKSDTWEVEVTQDSYTPESVHFEQDPSCVTKREFSVRTFVQPGYADFSKLKVNTSEGCTASVADGYMRVKLSDYGKFGISILSKEEEIYKVDGECVPPEPFQHDTQEAYLGQEHHLIDYWYQSDNYVLHSANPSVVSIDKDGTPRAVGFGTAIVSVTHPKADCYDEITIKVEPFLLEARIGWCGQKWDYSYDVRFAARTESSKDMTFDGFVVIDKNGYAKILNDGTVKGTQFGENARIHTISTSSINVTRSGYPNVGESLRGYKIMVQMSSGGKTYQRTVPINVMNVAFY